MKRENMSAIIDQWSNNVNNYGHGIMCGNCLARKYSEGGNAVELVEMGTFVQVHSIRDNDVLFCIVRDDMQVDTNKLLCKKADVISVPENLWGPLFTVEPIARLALVADSNVAESMGNISVGHTVQVLGPDRKIVCMGDVTFRNTIPKLGVGVFFGLKVVTFKNSLQTVIEKVSLLNPGTKGFPRGCDIVVTVDKLRPNNLCHNIEASVHQYDRENRKHSDRNQILGEDVNNLTYKSSVVLNLRDKFSNNSKKYQNINNTNAESSNNYTSTKEVLNSDNSLFVGDKIVYLHGDTPEKGVVKWIGFIKNSLKVGVEFDNPIGSGTGTVDGKELFKAKYSHALIVPPKALIKLSDFMMNSTKETVQYKNNNYNSNVNNNNNNNNNNITNNNNNNNNYNSLRSNDLCCENKQNNEDKLRLLKSNSYQCLKHPERTFHSDESFHCKNSDEDNFFNKYSYINDGHKLDNLCESQSPPNSRSFDLGKPTERNTSYRRQYNSVDSDLIENNDSGFYSQSQKCNIPAAKSPSQDFYDLMGPNWLKQEKAHNYCIQEHLEKDLEDKRYVSYKNITDHLDDEKKKKDKDAWDTPYSDHSSSEDLANYYDTPKPTSSHTPEELGKGSVVELIFKGEAHYGVIRWIGVLPEERDGSPPVLIAGIEMEEERNGLTDGTFNNKRYFQCNPKKALFVPLSKCRKDSRFLEETQKQTVSSKINYGQIDCPVVEGTIPPINTKEEIDSICGKNRGIQGHHNSCYLDATLFSMFAFTSVFDSLLYRPPTKHDIPRYSEVQRVLRDEIVNPLRKNLYVRADRVMKLRTLLDKLSSVSGLTSEEKDPEEFLNSLLAQILKAEPFLKLSSGQETFHYQLFVEKDERLVFPSVQQLFEQSFVTSDIKLKQVPSCLIIQMPRFGKSFKMYSRILPPQLLDVTDIIENSPRQCTVCGKSAEFECKDCFGQNGIGNGLESISFCRTCLETAHNHHCRTRHNYRSLSVPVEFSELQEHCIIPRLYMELFAVVCIETSHYVAFVKCGSGSDAPWCFFDSMADRKGEQNGYNIPEMVPCPDLPYWLSEDGAKMLNEMRDDRQLPEHAKRLFSDAYMCMYQSPDMMMYR